MNDTAKQTYPHFEWGHPIQGNDTLYFNRSGDGEPYLLFSVSREGIRIEANDFRYPTSDVMRETVDVMRELVARFDALQGGAS